MYEETQEPTPDPGTGGEGGGSDAPTPGTDGEE